MNREFAGMGAKLAKQLEPIDIDYTNFLEYPNPNQDRLILNKIT